MMPFTLSSLPVVIGSGPVALQDRVCGKLVEALLDKARAGKAATLWTHFAFPLRSVTGAMPEYFATSSEELKRLRSDPITASRRGAKAVPLL